jgi:hypothetical protein
VVVPLAVAHMSLILRGLMSPGGFRYDLEHRMLVRVLDEWQEATLGGVWCARRSGVYGRLDPTI